MATKAQKENQARFKAVQAEVKKLKAKNPKLAHTAAVKQAWAILYAKGGKTKKVAAKNPAKKASAKKAVAKKKVGAVKAKAPIKRKVAPKKKMATKSYHKDTQSHNVSVRVMSGVGKVNIIAMKQYQDALKDLDRWNYILSRLEQTKSDKSLTPIYRTLNNIDIKRAKQGIKEQKQHIKELKKLI